MNADLNLVVDNITGISASGKEIACRLRGVDMESVIDQLDDGDLETLLDYIGKEKIIKLMNIEEKE